MDISKNPWWFIQSVLFMCFSLWLHFSLGADRISANQSLSGDHTIVSAGGVFALGFFKPGKSSNYYVGMWYKKVSRQTTVWVANREKPVTDKYSSELRISLGNLVLFDGSKIPVWSTNLSTAASNSMEAVLLDEGNLVLRDGSSSSEPLWQSFDHPTDTWLPGVKIRLSKVTGEYTRLVSWKNIEDPAPGPFSLQLDLNETSRFIALFNMSRQYWKSGRWNGELFDVDPEMGMKYIDNITCVDNDKESYITYSLYNSSIFSRFVMDVGGQIQQTSWLEPAGQWSLFWEQPSWPCQVYARCGAFGVCTMIFVPPCHCLAGFVPNFADEWKSEVYSGGCKRNATLHRGYSSLVNCKSDHFLESYNILLPADPQPLDVGSAQECKSNCLNNCYCTAYAFDNTQCSIWFGDLVFLQQLADFDFTGSTLYVRIAASEFSSSKNSKGIVWGVVASFGVTAVALIRIVLFVIFRRRNRAIKAGKTEEGLLKAFGYRYLKKATNNFSEKLGEGGFGSVFKGTLPDSSVIAVKKIERISQGDKEFRMEVSTLGIIQHVNLVRLRGFCSEGTRKLLVYDYMPNGSLDSCLFEGRDSIILNWKTRYNIALGTAKGLAYLHEECRDCIVHCDIKPENILLDNGFCPKLADFGVAKLFGRDFSRVLTPMRGTIGYLAPSLAPEWISGEAVTAKADVYSYGMVLLELVSGRRNSEQSKNGKTKYFPIRVARLINENGDVLSLVDPFLQGNANVDELTRVCKVACWCIQDDITQRPSMGEIVYILQGVLDVNLPPIPRSLEQLSWRPEGGMLSS
ncbi:G-type lectin S-receptor-like serine/threonine-protein kinase At2g19130 [Hevea brasiliensis]|uniref:G-type lectin S-receptor-like serine/threonine-protein kinase At2g19130 n=1 Tax=Hevea brasiliensis TaxID=3981 RepID=UPI0025CBFD3A|nr:G-type lectin S-receptor-like serine/threonine-protein kinase At2g19130 [Hevea brasiliensis]